MLCTVILIPPLFGGRRIHDTEASWMHSAAMSWILRLPTKNVGSLRMTMIVLCTFQTLFRNF